MDKQTEATGDFIAGLAEQSAQGYLIQAQDEEIKRLKTQRDQAVKACQAAIRYDKVVKEIGGDPYKMISFCTAEDESLDDLYLDWLTKARAAIAATEDE